MPVYDATAYDPPAPIARVTLRNPSTAAIVTDVPMLLDTGADATLVPQAIVEQLGIAIDSSSGYQLMGFDGNVTVASSVEADLILLSRAFKGKFLLTSEACGILGRDILNHLSVLFDGPRLSWTEHKP